MLGQILWTLINSYSVASGLIISSVASKLNLLWAHITLSAFILLWLDSLKYKYALVGFYVSINDKI